MVAAEQTALRGGVLALSVCLGTPTRGAQARFRSKLDGFLPSNKTGEQSDSPSEAQLRGEQLCHAVRTHRAPCCPHLLGLPDCSRVDMQGLRYKCVHCGQPNGGQQIECLWLSGPVNSRIQSSCGIRGANDLIEALPIVRPVVGVLSDILLKRDDTLLTYGIGPLTQGVHKRPQIKCPTT